MSNVQALETNYVCDCRRTRGSFEVVAGEGGDVPDVGEDGEKVPCHPGFLRIFRAPVLSSRKHHNRQARKSFGRECRKYYILAFQPAFVVIELHHGSTFLKILEQ